MASRPSSMPILSFTAVSNMSCRPQLANQVAVHQRFLPYYMHLLRMPFDHNCREQPGAVSVALWTEL
jgi:hypothetical protein